MADGQGKSRRQRQILDLLARNQVASQVELLDLLLAEGVRATQSTLSRDLREMGIVKGVSGYRMPAGGEAGPLRLDALARAISPRLSSVDWGGNLVVLGCVEPADAGAIAMRIAKARLHHAAGAMACDGSVLVVARSQTLAREMVRAFRERPRRARTVRL